MSLRVRLLAAALTVIMLLIAFLSAIVVRQRDVLLTQVDDQLSSAAAALGSPALRSGQIRAAIGERPNPAAPGDIFVAAVSTGGELQIWAQPVSDPDLRIDPSIAELQDRIETPDDPSSIAPFSITAGPDQDPVRVTAVGLTTDFTVVIGRSTAHVDEAQQQLVLTSILAVIATAATLAVLLWWVDRLGLRPISRVTVAAEEIAAGRSDRRVTHPPTSTESGRLGAAFNTMLDARQEAEARQSRFVADAAHELRTPLTTLRGYTALYRSGGLAEPPAVDDAMRRIGIEANRMADLVEDLLTLASLDEDRPLDLVPVDLSRLLNDIATDAAAVQPGRPVDTADVEGGLRIVADQHLLTQAITAVTSNALRHTPTEAGLTLVAWSATNGAGSANGRDGTCVVVEVTDRGGGIPADRLDRLFDRFYRADSARSAATGGRGLGLSIAKQAVERHGGLITARSQVDRGTTITLRLPAGPPGQTSTGAPNRSARARM
ncbi:MAG: ATP-binding protein [Actinomycetota bacterium]